MKYLVICSALCIGLAPLGSTAASDDRPILLAQATEETERPAKAKKKKDKRVCKRVKNTGSRIPERVCRKQSEWDQITRRSRENVERSYEGSGRVTAGGES